MTVFEIACFAHPDRAAIGACTRCGVALCDECSARLEGRLVCARCVAPAAAPVVPQVAWRSLDAAVVLLLLGPLALLVVAGVLYAFVWLIALAAGGSA